MGLQNINLAPGHTPYSLNIGKKPLIQEVLWCLPEEYLPLEG